MVIMRFAFLPIVMLPCVLDNPIAYAPFNVAALIASSGVIFILIQAVATTKFMFPEGVLPGLKSDAKAIGSPAAMICRAGVYGMEIKNEQPGKATGIVCDDCNA